MDDEIRKHLRSIRILVTLALLAAFLSFAFTYLLFKEVSTPLEAIRSQQIAKIESKIDDLATSRADSMKKRAAIELELAVHDLEQIASQSSGEVADRAAKALEETRALLELLKGPPAQSQAVPETAPQPEQQVQGGAGPEEAPAAAQTEGGEAQ